MNSPFGFIRPTRLGLRSRMAFAFATTTAVLAALMASATFGLTRENLINQREASVTRQARQNAAIMERAVETDSTSEQVRIALTSLETPTGARPIVEIRRGTSWQAQALQPAFGGEAVPASMRASVTNQVPARMLLQIQGELNLVIGIPINDGRAAYYEIVSFQELQDTLRALGISLFGATVLTTVAAGMAGYWLSRRTLRPLSNVGLAAEAIAGGRLDTRLETTTDPDLNVLVSSFNHMAQALEDRIDRDARFASDVSHELRSPLMTLAASVSVLASRKTEMPDDSSRSALELMEADVSRFQQLVDDLLEISRFDAGVARLSLEEVLLPELVRQAIAQRRMKHPPRLDVDLELSEMIVRADKRRLLRILDNLLGNADAYGAGASRVSVEAAGDNVLIAVEDDGPGVKPEDRARIFDRFSRGASAGRRSATGDGVGLGLALVAEHARLHGGRTWVEDRPDGSEGARFVVRLPVTRA